MKTVMRYLAYIGQLGISMALPIVGCTWSAWQVCMKFDLSRAWIILGVFVGIGMAGVAFARFAKMMQTATQKEETQDENRTRTNRTDDCQ